MTRKIIKIGDSEGVTIPKNIKEKLNLKAGDELEVQLDKEGKQILLEPSDKKSGGQNDKRKERIAKLTASFTDKYRKDLEALAEK